MEEKATSYSDIEDGLQKAGRDSKTFVMTMWIAALMFLAIGGALVAMVRIAEAYLAAGIPPDWYGLAGVLFVAFAALASVAAQYVQKHKSAETQVRMAAIQAGVIKRPAEAPKS